MYARASFCFALGLSLFGQNRLVAAQDVQPADQAAALTPESAIQLALRNNAGFRAALLDALAAQAKFEQEEAARELTFTASANASHTENLGSGVGTVSRTDADGALASVGLRYRTSLGTELSFELETGINWRKLRRDLVSAATYSSGEQISGAATLSARQPLLRGAGPLVALANQELARLDARTAEVTRSVRASELVRDVLVAYYELWYDARAEQVQQQALSLAQQQVEQATARRQLGTATNVDVAQFSSALAERREALSLAHSATLTQARSMGVIVGGDIAPTFVTAELEVLASNNDLARLVSELAERSLRLLQLRQQLESLRLQERVTQDTALVRLDATASVSASTLWAKDDLSGLELPDSRPAVTAMVGLDLELPTSGTSRGRAVRRAELVVNAALARYDQAHAEETATVQSLEETTRIAHERMRLAQETIAYAEQAAAGEREKLALGTSTPSQVLDAEQTLREANLRRLRAVVDALSGQVRLEHAAGLLLQRFSIGLEAL